MAYDYSEDLAFAVEVITDFGQTYTFTRMNEGVDEANPLGPSLVADTTVNLAGVSLEVIGNEFGRYIDLKELIANSDMVVLFPGYVAYDLETFNFVSGVDGKLWKLDKMMTFKPGDTPLLHFAGLCK